MPKRKPSGTVQLSFMPDYYPDTLVMKQKEHSLRNRIRAILRKEGFYNFAKLAVEALSHDDKWIEGKYGVKKEILAGMLNGEFGERCGFQETIETYLHKVKTIPMYGLEEVKDGKA